METEKLYYVDPFLREFTATVLACEPWKNGFNVVLDRTAFYPESGGQPADHGMLNGIAVADVHEKGGVVFHNLEKSVEIGETVTGVLDWSRRFDHMQQHSGEHIISGILCADYHCDNVGFHMGADTVTIDYNADITWEQLMIAERKANEVIYADAPVDIQYPSPEDLATLDYRSKKELTGQVRIVTFPEADCCACCGTHVLRAGKVGLVKVLSCQKFREGVRLEILCGRRALRYLSAVYDQDRGVAQRLSVKPVDTLAAVERLEGELAAAKERTAALEEQVFFHIAEKHAETSVALIFQPIMKSDSIRRLADTVARRSGGMAAVFSGVDGQYAYALVRADGADIGGFIKELNTALHGRGGGKKGFAQGSVQAERTAIEAFFEHQEEFSCTMS